MNILNNKTSYGVRKQVILGGIIVLIGIAVHNSFLGTPTLVNADLSNVRQNQSVLETTSQTLSLVTRVIDGDTIIATVNGVSERIRLIGVDTPEIVDPRKPVQCFGEESSAFTKSLLEHKEVHLEADASQDNRDKYGRLLRYVFLEDGTLINKEIIAEGYGREYTYQLPYQYQSEFKITEKNAQATQKGLWAPDVCVQQ